MHPISPLFSILMKAKQQQKHCSRKNMFSKSSPQYPDHRKRLGTYGISGIWWDARSGWWTATCHVGEESRLSTQEQKRGRSPGNTCGIRITARYSQHPLGWGFALFAADQKQGFGRFWKGIKKQDFIVNRLKRR